MSHKQSVGFDTLVLQYISLSRREYGFRIHKEFMAAYNLGALLSQESG